MGEMGYLVLLVYSMKSSLVLVDRVLDKTGTGEELGATLLPSPRRTISTIPPDQKPKLLRTRF
tara:strand:+ start:2523 stop:2711 length:189 start_codon:yes stop_codon:yes gene_type:complete